MTCGGMEIWLQLYFTSTVGVGGGSGQLHAPASLFPVVMEYVAGWDPEAFWALWRGQKSIDLQDSNH